MTRRRVVALMIATLVLGLTLGGIASVVAAPSADGGRPLGALECNGSGPGGGMRGMGVRLGELVAGVTGVEREVVCERRQAGESLAAIAEEAGSSTDAVVDEALEARKKALDERVAAGVISQEQADVMQERMREQLDERLDSTEACDPGARGKGCGSRSGFAGERGAGLKGSGGRGMGGPGGCCAKPVDGQ